MVASPSGTKKGATMKDIEALPPTMKGEIIDGVLYAHARPRPIHQATLLAIASDIDGPFSRTTQQWWILGEPGIELPGAPEVSPDVAGWRRDRMPSLPTDRSIDIVPDWCCEILSPSTRRYDLAVKRPFYARVGVRFVWYVDLEARTLTVSQLEGGRWVELGVYTDDSKARIAPFDDVELALARWWANAPPLTGD